MVKLAILASGNGTNAQRISEYFADSDRVKVECIIYNRKDAYVAERAKKLGIPAENCLYVGDGGSFELDGKEYVLVTNNGPNHLHGGDVGFSDRLWTVEEATDTRVVMTLESPDGEEGYPGTVKVSATYTVEGRSLKLELEGTTDAPTLLNLTNHAYWNLDGTGVVNGHCLLVHAQEYTPMVANIPTGQIAPVVGTPYDLNTPALLGSRNAPGVIPGGYDDNYVLPAANGVREAAVLTNGRRTLRVLTDAPGLQVYTGDYLPLPRGGVALEAQNFPDSPHHANFPSIVLRPGQTYRRTIVWEID